MRRRAEVLLAELQDLNEAEGETAQWQWRIQQEGGT
jgi:hypothetical protein